MQERKNKVFSVVKENEEFYLCKKSLESCKPTQKTPYQKEISYLNNKIFSKEDFDEFFQGKKLITFFDFGSSVINPIAEKNIHKLALMMREKSMNNIILIASTDAFGSKEINNRLVKKRAEVVKRIFLNEGINAQIHENTLCCSQEVKTDLLIAAWSKFRTVSIQLGTKK